MRGADLVALAARVARDAHSGQVDKAGAAYISHPARVAAGARERAQDSDADLVEAAAWLHDVVEDTGTTLDDLAELGFPKRLVAAVDAITRKPGEPSDTYYARVAASPIALVVKFADLADNSDPERLALLDPLTGDRLRAKYDHAEATLTRLAESRSKAA